MRAIQRYVPLAILFATFLAAFGSIIASDLASAQTSTPRVIVVEIDGPINSTISRYVNRALIDANDNGASAVVMVLNTAGGEDTYINSIVNRIASSNVPIVTWVGPGDAQAISNGLNLVYAAQIAAMSPEAIIGNSPPVMSGSRAALFEDDEAHQQAEDQDIARLQKMARRNGHNEEWVVSAVRDGATVTADEALQMGVVNQVQPNLDSLLVAIDGTEVNTAAGLQVLDTDDVPIQINEMTWFEEMMDWLAQPTLAYLLVSFGMLSIYFELANPGLGVPSVLGVIMLVIGMMGLSGLPVSWIGLGFMLLAFVLFLLDIFVPSLGLLTIAGLASFLIGSNVLIARGAAEELQIPQHIITTVTICLGGLAVLIGMLAVKAQFWKTQSGRDDLVGRTGVTATPLNPIGMVHVFGELWNASSDGGPIEMDQPVVVTRVDGIRLVVRPSTVESPAGNQPPNVESIGDRHTVIPVR
jgi:membrane-bound serine protease (ClpP class)